MTEDLPEDLPEDLCLFDFLTSAEAVKAGGLSSLRNYLVEGDCFDVFPLMQSGSVDLILTDLPYSITGCDWDLPIDLAGLWAQWKRVLRPGGAVVMTGMQPFTSALVMSNPKWFRQELIWKKRQGTDPMHAKKRIMKIHENILVFCDRQTTYNPQMVAGTPFTAFHGKEGSTMGEVYNKKKSMHAENLGTRYPVSVQEFGRELGFHPTAKPTLLWEWLMKTYSNPGDLVLDPCSGGGTTGVAALRTGRRFLCIEKSAEYAAKSRERLLSESAVIRQHSGSRIGAG